MTTYGYARVSKAQEDGSTTLENQHRQLRDYGVDSIFDDVVTGIAAARSGLASLLDVLAPGDTVAFVAVDRLGRDTVQGGRAPADIPGPQRRPTGAEPARRRAERPGRPPPARVHSCGVAAIERARPPRSGVSASGGTEPSPARILNSPLLQLRLRHDGSRRRIFRTGSRRRTAQALDVD